MMTKSQKIYSAELLCSAFVIFISIIGTNSHPPCGLYGAPPCQFVPAPPGKTPPCARPGKTYCEHVDAYPTYLIKHLVQKWGYEAKNLIIDETSDEFTALRYQHHEISHFYDPANIFGPPVANHLNSQFDGYKYDAPHGQHHGYPEPIYIPKPQDTDLLIYSSLTSPNYKQKISNTWTGPKVSHYNPAEWLRRYTRDLSHKKLREQQTIVSASNSTKFSKDVSSRNEFLDLFSDSNQNKHRSKRQNQNPDRNPLCRTSSEFITPQAALNTQGNWMYVVNDNNVATQQVRAVSCASSTCSPLCQLPLSYTSRCEQRYVQKRLVALQENGQRLKTDTFWFPSCCICTLSNS